MMRKIEFIAHSRALSFSVSSVIGGLSILLIMRFIFFMEHSVITYGFVFVGAIFQYFNTSILQYFNTSILHYYTRMRK